MNFNDALGTTPAPRSRAPQRRTIWTALGTGFSLLVAAALWVAFAPPSLGGHLSMLVVNGNSMEPGIHRGDLAFVTNDGRPTVGDVVAYREPQIGVVIHRVIADDGERLTLQGDNRTTVDTYRPAYNEVVGGLAFMVPNGMTYLQFLSNPRTMVVIVVLTMLVGAASSTRVRSGLRRRSSQPFGTPVSARGIEALAFSHPTGTQVASAAVIAIVGAAGLLLLVNRQGYTAPATTTVMLAERGDLSYTGDGPAGLYEGDRLAAPQPIIRGATHGVNVTYDYSLVAGESRVVPQAVSGTYTLTAQLRHETGWQRDLVLRPETAFQGASARATGTLNMDQVNVLASQLEQALHIQEGLTTYTLRVVAEVHATGTAAGVPFERDVEQQMQFVMTNRVLSLDSTAGKTVMHLSEQPTVQTASTTERHLAIPMTGLSFAYRDLPAFAWMTIGASTLVLALGAAASLTLARMGEAAQIRVRYGHQMVDVAEGSNAVPESAVFVKRFQDLLTIASTEGTTIGHLVDEGIHVYFVRAMSESYVYWIAPQPVVADAPARAEEVEA